MKTHSKRKETGASIIVVISIMATLMVIVGVATDLSLSINRNVKRSTTYENAIAIGDGSLDLMFGYWREICRSQPTTPLPTSSFSSITLPTTTELPSVFGATSPFVARGTSGFAKGSSNDELATSKTISNYKVVAVDPLLNDLASTGTAPNPGIGQQTTSATFNYMASADVTLPGLTNKVVAKVRRIFQKQQMSPWNFAIFYVDPLEIHPSPPLTVNGWVHTNSDLYTAHSTLTFADKVTYGHDWTIGFMPGDNTHPETPASPNYPANLPPALDVAKQPFGLDSTRIFNTTDTNPNNDSYHELIEPPVTPVSTNPDPLAGERYWDQANIIIQVADNPNPNANGFDGQKGHDLVTFYTVNSSTGATTQITSGSLYNLFAGSGAIITNQSIQDDREGATIGLVNFDISKIENGLSNTSLAYKSPLTGTTPVVYIYDSSATSSKRRGVRLVGGSKIPTYGLTVASPNPVYIQGDYNTGGAPPSDNTVSDPTTPQVTGYNSAAGQPGYRAPCSVIADAVSILSNSWSDANSSGALSARVASNTTVNTAIVSGIVPSGGGNYSGGAENFPRFLEDWTNKTFTYYGSMVELYSSQQSTGIWGLNSATYQPPIRQWYFDSNFYVNSPPGSLMIYSYIKGQWALAQ